MVVSRKFYFKQWGAGAIALFVALLLEFTPTRFSQVLEGDITLSYTPTESVSVIMVLLYYIVVVLAIIALILVFSNTIDRRHV